MIKMDALKKMYEDLNFENVRTYIQSGNVIFQYNQSELTDLEERIASQIKTQFGFEVPVMIFSIEELKIIIERNPFRSDKSKDISHLHVTFLSSPPEQDNFETLEQAKSTGEEIILNDKAIYLYCPNGYGKTKLTNTFLERKLKVRATTRNWKTINELVSIAEKIPND